MAKCESCGKAGASEVTYFSDLSIQTDEDYEYNWHTSVKMLCANCKEVERIAAEALAKEAAKFNIIVSFGIAVFMALLLLFLYLFF